LQTRLEGRKSKLEIILKFSKNEKVENDTYSSRWSISCMGWYIRWLE